MFVWRFILVLVLLPAAASNDLETLTLEISKLGRKMDTFQSFVFQDISSIKDKIHKMDSKMDAILRQGQNREDIHQAQSGSQTHEEQSLNDIVEPIALQQQLERIKRGFKEEKEGIRHELDDLKGISQNLLVGKDQITEYLLTLEKNVNTFLNKIIGELKDGILDITKNVQRDLNMSIEHSADGIEEKAQSLKELVERTDTISKSRSDMITETLTTALSASEKTIVGYLNDTSLKTAVLVDSVKQDINIIKENTDKIIANANMTSPVRLANKSEYLNGVQGRLEILHDGVWGTVCDDGFEEIDAKVACKMIDVNLSFDKVQPSTYYGPGTGMIWLDDMSCNGEERSLFNCPGVVIGKHNCGHVEDVGIRCWYR
ncbi:scavenger receptor cysteine-rich type 1 protein M130-like [Mya arenaria]|uniref:scavenger receptor cysteine-rich type 1 protein M130-like n=1 Tax=Mya arenaria TaxID=6604 RepID=UPI0022E3ADDA|nr:scavenger receptor cysteine-rich type 1 protein M130-like [Mya arenaria]